MVKHAAFSDFLYCYFTLLLCLGLWSVGIVVYTVNVLVVNFKLALITCSWNWLTHFTLWGTLAFYFFSMAILGLSPTFSNAGADYTGEVFKLWYHISCSFAERTSMMLHLFLGSLLASG